MRRTILVLLSLAGCGGAPTAPPPGQPVITSGQQPGDFGPIAVATGPGSFSFSFRATDANTVDELFAFLFHVDGAVDTGTYLSLGGIAGLPMSPTTSSPADRDVTFDARPWCCLLGGACSDTSQSLVYAFVSTDQNPVIGTKGPPMFHGPSDGKYWIVNCQ
jgi:hypothetical protein